VILGRVARFFLAHGNKPGKDVPTKSTQNVRNGHKIYQHFPIKGPPKFTPIGIFGLKINHLATRILGTRCSGSGHFLKALVIGFYPAAKWSCSAKQKKIKIKNKICFREVSCPRQSGSGPRYFYLTSTALMGFKLAMYLPWL
jgi:hypothetical protein